LPKAAKLLNLSFHELVSRKNDQTPEVDNDHIPCQKLQINLYERLLKEIEDKDTAKDILIENLTESAENWKNKYYNMKKRVIALEEKLKC